MTLSRGRGLSRKTRALPMSSASKCAVIHGSDSEPEALRNYVMFHHELSVAKVYKYSTAGFVGLGTSRQ